MTTDGTADPARPHVLFVSAEGVGVRGRRALVAAGFQVTGSSLDAPVRGAVAEVGPDLVVVAYRAALRRRAWLVLTVLRGSRALRAIPVVVATDDAEQVEGFRETFRALGITVLIEPGEAALVATVRLRLDHRAALPDA